MMISIRAKDIHLSYKVRGKPTLGLPDRRMRKTGGAIEGEGRNRMVHALKGVSFEFKAGDRVGLIGSNGAGKTSLLKVLYGLYEPTSGDLLVNGRVDALFNINLGFRREATGRRNIELRGMINGLRREEIDARLDEIIAFSDLGEFIDMPLKSYSAGMAARLAFSVAVALDPEILLMDEWIGAGDSDFQEKARARMQEITEKAGIVVLASHNQNLINKVCNRVLRLEGGVASEV